ncbi:TBC1 domain family member 30 isoform X1 [Pelobates cultripes]|uniref:TBC1 domain family member 30 n=1 Tax=Pelobates cultripes TaxID=61616 RepID=A0AAD1RT42_PELCU|nr:TBC1 domain family member 30 isoform X1 [Pelobates cultripes]CAH2277796.1 TBC1 domain family member 30 isoform X1 [Pelobates cultripes]CAH2277797.1 TBC1 domain family member 30 isoform X1 [Pelobates cultripes]
MEVGTQDVDVDLENDVFVYQSLKESVMPARNGWPTTFPAVWPPQNHDECETANPVNGHLSGRGSIDSVNSGFPQEDFSRTTSLVNGLLTELYDTYRGGLGNGRVCHDSIDSSTEASGSDAFLSRSNPESAFLQELSEKQSLRHQIQYLRQKDCSEIKAIREELDHQIWVHSAKLLRQLKQKDRLQNKVQKNCDIVTACLQAVSQKRRVDTKLKFTLEPSLGQNGFQQWYDALKAVARLPTGIPKEWRRRVWLNLADHYLHSISIDWEKTLRFTFNERSNPDDDSMGIQIVKDLHRTGCSSYCGQEAEQDRVVLKRVLLAYARWNKSVGYCQGFNILAALILEVMEGNEGDALKIMIYLIDKVLPDSYFVNNLRALSVDMAVFRDLLRMKLPELSQHLDVLQRTANKESGGGYEPPLTNVFTMQWFLTLFATCLPNHTVLKIWDSVFFEGSEIILRVALAIWEKLGEQIECCENSDDFYSTMGRLTQEMLEDNLIDSNELMQTVYSMAPFPFPQLAELREKYTYNITPFPAPVKSASFSGRPSKMRDSDEENDLDEEDFNANAFGCLGPFSGLLIPELQRYQKQIKDQKENQSLQPSNIAELSPGAIDSCRSDYHAVFNSMMMERMTTDIHALKQQYSRIKKRQLQQINQVYIRAGLEEERDPGIPRDPRDQLSNDKGPVSSILPSQVNNSPVINHLLLGKKLKQVNRSKNAVVQLPTSKSSIQLGEDSKSKVNSPWRTHIRVHRKNIARAKSQLGYGDTIGLIEEQNDIPKDQMDDSKEPEEIVQDPVVDGEESNLDRTVMKVDGHSPEPVYQDENANVTVVQSKLEALELNTNDESDTKSEIGQALPDTPSDSQSSSSESGTLTKSPKGQVFSPFPSVKPLRKSTTARNLGLYGPNNRTPTVHFPHMSKSFNKPANGTTGSKKR